MENRTIGKIKAFELARNVIGFLFSMGLNKSDIEFIMQQMPVIIKKSYISKPEVHHE
jgi:hypothetical protein